MEKFQENHNGNRLSRVHAACTGTASRLLAPAWMSIGTGTRVFWEQLTCGLCLLWAVGFIS